jgi:hypothetical protein
MDHSFGIGRYLPFQKLVRQSDRFLDVCGIEAVVAIDFGQQHFQLERVGRLGYLFDSGVVYRNASHYRDVLSRNYHFDLSQDFSQDFVVAILDEVVVEPFCVLQIGMSI